MARSARLDLRSAGGRGDGLDRAAFGKSIPASGSVQNALFPVKDRDGFQMVGLGEHVNQMQLGEVVAGE